MEEIRIYLICYSSIGSTLSVEVDTTLGSVLMGITSKHSPLVLKSNVSLGFVTMDTNQGLSNGSGTKNTCNTRDGRMKGQVFLFGLVQSTNVKPCLSILFLLLSAQSHLTRTIFLRPSLNDSLRISLIIP